MGWLPLGDVDDEVTTTRASAPRPPPPRRSAAGPGEVLDGAGPQAPPPGRRHGRRRGRVPPGRRPAPRGPGPGRPHWASGGRAGPGRRRPNPHRRRPGWTGRRFPGGPCDSLMSAPLRGAQGLRYGQVASHSKGKWDTGPWTARFWTAGAGASARRDRRECPDPTWWKWDIPDPGGPSAVGGRPPTRRPPERNPVNCSAESCADPATRQASPQASPLEVLDGEQTVRESRSACGWPNPESTERRLWGQSLKKPEGAPSRASQLPQRAIEALCGD